MLAPPTRETGSGVWVGTPTTGDALGSTGRSERFRTKTPTPLEFVNMWPTPHGFSPDGKTNGPSGNELGRAVNQSLRCATPTARDWRSGKASQATHDKNSRPLSEQVGGSLNPDWVELLMLWPKGWTDLNPLVSADMRGFGEGWEDGTPRVAVGVKHRAPRLKAIGNGQVPLCATTAWRLLHVVP